MRAPLLLLLLLLVPPWPPSPRAVDTSVQDRKAAELKALRDEIAAVQGRLSEARSNRDALQDQLRDTEVRVGRSSASLRRIARDLADKGVRLGELRESRRQLGADLAAQRKVLSNQVRAAYIIGRQDYLKILLNQEDPAVLSRVLTYYDYFNRARARQIAGLAEQVERLNAVERAIARETAALEALHRGQLAEKAELETQRSLRRQVLADLGIRIREDGARLDRLSEDASRLERLLSELRRVFADIPTDMSRRKPFAKMRKHLPWPFPGRILHAYGTPRGLGNLKWQGVIIDARQGDPIHAIYHGRVAFADWLRGQGLLIILDHGNGFMSLYGHNESLLKETGDWVEPGDVIATAGDSGGRSQAGLYFEIRRNGAPINPARWCSRGTAATARAALVSP